MSINSKKGIATAIIISVILNAMIAVVLVNVYSKGDKGAKGAQGIQGMQGIQGIIGEQGFAGERGIPGIQGIKGTQGIKGDKGDTGAQGLPGGVEPFVSGNLKSTYYNVLLGTDYRIVTGFLVNFGGEPAINVRIKLTWSYSGGSYSKTTFIGTLHGHQIYSINNRYNWEGSAGSLSYTITWD